MSPLGLTRLSVDELRAYIAQLTAHERELKERIRARRQDGDSESHDLIQQRLHWLVTRLGGSRGRALAELNVRASKRT